MLESSVDKDDLEDEDDDDSDIYGLMNVNQVITHHRYPDIVADFSEN